MPEYTPENIQSETDEEIEIDKSFDNRYDTCIEENSNHSVAEVEEQTNDTNDTSANKFQVSRATKNVKHKLVKDKRVFCLYCEELITNFPRHLERKHPLEDDVRKIIIMPKKSLERNNYLELLKNKGNLQYTYSDLKKGITCPECGTLAEKFSGYSQVCTKCGNKINVNKAIRSSIEDFHTLFPEIKLTSRRMMDWCGCGNDMRVYRVLKKNYRMIGKNRGRYYI